MSHKCIRFQDWAYW